jgi:glutaminase
MILTVVLGFSIEMFNARADIFGQGDWRIWSSIHSIVNMIFWPYVIWAMARFRIWKG